MNKTIELTKEMEEPYLCLDFTIEVDFTCVEGSHSYHATSDYDYHGHRSIDSKRLVEVTATNENGDTIDVPAEYLQSDLDKLFTDDELLEQLGSLSEIEEDAREAAAETRFEAERNGDYE
jgi:hypothetical protein